MDTVQMVGVTLESISVISSALDKGLIPDVIARDVSKSAWNL